MNHRLTPMQRLLLGLDAISIPAVEPRRHEPRIPGPVEDPDVGPPRRPRSGPDAELLKVAIAATECPPHDWRPDPDEPVKFKKCRRCKRRKKSETPWSRR